METSVFMLLALVAIIWLWFDSLRTRETATDIARDACNRLGVQLLDETVALQKWALGRNPLGRLRLRRVYRFDFSTGDGNRYRAMITMLGGYLEHLDLSEAQQQLT